jgi:hypothetical protein
VATERSICRLTPETAKTTFLDARDPNSILATIRCISSFTEDVERCRSHPASRVCGYGTARPLPHAYRMYICMADRPCGTEPCYRFSVWLLGTPTLLNCILTSALKLNSRVRSRHIIVPPPLVCNNMNADGASRDRSSNTYESLD